MAHSLFHTRQMATMRSKDTSSLLSPAPPPSPIPTGKGSRSAANPIFSDHLYRSIEIPKLSLPVNIQIHRSILADIDLQLLASREVHSVERLMNLAAESGVFRISGHGIRVDQLRSALAEGDESGYFRIYGNHRELMWRSFVEAVAARAEEVVVEGEKWRSFRYSEGAETLIRFNKWTGSQRMENLVNELEAIAREVAEILYETTNMQQLIHEGIYTRESSLSLHRYDWDSIVGESPSISTEEKCPTFNEHALSLHVPLGQCRFLVHPKQGQESLSFNAGPDTIVVTIGEQLKDWSCGELKSTNGEVIFEPNLYKKGSSFSIELKFRYSLLSREKGKIYNTISISDQILLILAITILFKMFVFIFF